MNMIRNLIDRHKAKKLAKQMEQRRKDDEYKEKLNAEVSASKTEMLSKVCPFNSGLCNESCVHFENGFVNRIYHTGEVSCYSYSVVVHCNCKLWRKL